MSGILDSKTRVLDSIVTLEGRKQLAAGGINIKYVSFTDTATYYKADVVSGSADATTRLYLESCQLPQDQVTFQADDLGRLLPFFITNPKSNTLSLGNGQVLEYSFAAPDPSVEITGSVRPMATTSTVTGDDLHAITDGVLSSSIDNFVKQQIIGTSDAVFGDDGFALSTTNVSFTITNDKPIPVQRDFTRNINQLEPILADPRMSHLPNFMFMPPVNRVDDASIDKTDRDVMLSYAVGSYRPLNTVSKIDGQQVVLEHEQYAKKGYAKTIKFEPTSRANNLFIQAFEVSNDTMFKLDIIDFGTWNAPPKTNPAFSDATQMGPMCQILFIGKLVTQPSTDAHTFVHLFTMIFGV